MHDFTALLTDRPLLTATLAVAALLLVLLCLPSGRAALLAFLVWLDRLVNWLLRGTFRETLSSRAHRMRLKGHPVWGWTADVIDWLFFWQPSHCATQWQYEIRQGWHNGDGT